MKKLCIFLSLILVFSIVFSACGNKPKTLDEITHSQGGGHLRYEVDNYTSIEIWFDCTGTNGDEQTGTCYVQTNHYKASTISPTGVLFDYAETEEYPCSYTNYSLTIGMYDNYTFSVETRNGREYVVFSKPFFGQTSWYVNKAY